VKDFEVTGVDDFLRLSKALKAAGEGGLRKELHKGLREAGAELIPLARTEARQTLPKSGGLADRVSGARMRVKVKTGRNPGVSIVAGKPGSGARGAEFGRIRHPVFGNRDVWVTQIVPAHWLTGTIGRHRNVVVPKLEAAMERVAKKVVSGRG
jgi:hypothetical protein